MVDDDDPSISFTASAEKHGTYNGVDYYPAGTLIIVTVIDKAFDADNSKVNGESVAWVPGENDVHTYEVELKADAEDIAVVAYDKVKNPSTGNGVSESYSGSNNGAKPAVDEEALTLEVSEVSEFCSSDVTVTASASADKSGINVAESAVTGGTVSWTEQDGVLSYEEKFEAEGSYTVIAKAVTNRGQVAVETRSFTIDKTAPTISLSYPNNSDTLNGKKLFEAAPTVTITVVEANFDPDKTIVELNSEPKMLDWALSNGAYTAELTIPGEGLYTISAETTDKAGTKSEVASDEFVVDSAAPALSVSFDNMDARSGSYYNANRTATVTVTEANFDAGAMTITAPAGEVSVWTSEGIVHTATVAFESEGTHSLVIEGSDAAGRAIVGTPATVVENGKYASDDFVIDKTAPVVKFVVDQKMTREYGGADYYSNQSTGESTLGIVVEVSDANFTTSEVTSSASGVIGTTSITPFGMGAVSGTWAESDGVWTHDVEFAQNAPDVPTSSLEVIVYDKAGNATAYKYGQTSQNASTVDNAGAALTTSSEKFVLDLTAPKVIYAASASDSMPDKDYKSSYEDGKYLFYSEPTTMRFVVTDELGLSSASLGKDKLTVGHPYRIESLTLSQDRLTCEVEVKLDDAYPFTRDVVLEAEDLSGNMRSWSIAKDGTVTDVTGSPVLNTSLYKDKADLYPEAVIQDTTAPALAFSGVQAGAYYNEAKTVTLDITELNFGYLSNFNTTVIDVAKMSGDVSHTPSSSVVSIGDIATRDAAKGEYYYDFECAADGHYSFSASLTDPVGHSGSASVGEFTIDRTVPTVAVSFDNNNAINGSYYAAGRTATIVLTEHNFDASKINIQTNGSVSSWSTDGDVHTATVSFQSDGRYNLSVSGEDMAGNALASYTADEFVVDMTAPTITFNEVSDGAAYGGEIAPVIVFADEANFDGNNVTYTLTGTKNGTVTYDASEADTTNGRTVSFANFQRIASVDDIYTLTATMTDMAGNEFSTNITFSVNRFGSNYRVVNADDYTENNGYLLESQDVLIEEINVSGCASETMAVTMTRGASAESLELTDSTQEKGYTIERGTSQASSSNGWALYTYRVAAGNFDTDGRYHIAVSSSDNAGNRNTSANYYDRESEAMAVAEVSFILDTTDPVITNLNIEDNKTYDGDTFEGSFTVVENIGIDKVDVVIDGESVNATGDGFGNYTFEVSGKSFAARNMDIIATDLAGRTGEASVGGFHVTSNILELHLPWVIGGLVVAGGLIFLFIRRKRQSEEEGAKAA